MSWRKIRESLLRDEYDAQKKEVPKEVPVDEFYGMGLPSTDKYIEDRDFSMIFIPLVGHYISYKGEDVFKYEFMAEKNKFHDDVPYWLRKKTREILDKAYRMEKLERERRHQAAINRRKAIFGGSNE